MKKKAQKKAPRGKKVKKTYKASIKVLGKIYTSEGGTGPEALSSLKVGNVAKGMSILTLSNGTLTKEKVLPSNATSRLFSPSRLTREIALKNITILFSGL